MATAFKNFDKLECNTICDVHYATNCSSAGSFTVIGAENIRQNKALKILKKHTYIVTI